MWVIVVFFVFLSYYVYCLSLHVVMVQQTTKILGSVCLANTPIIPCPSIERVRSSCGIINLCSLTQRGLWRSDRQVWSDIERVAVIVSGESGAALARFFR